MNAKPIEIDNNISDLNILSHSELFVENNVTVDNAGKSIPNDIYFKNFDSNYFISGYTTNEAVWVRFKLKNIDNLPIARVLHIDNSMLDKIVIYEDGKLIATYGALYRHNFTNFRDFYQPIKIEPHQTKTFELCLISNSSATYFHLFIEDNSVMWHKVLTKDFILTFFFTVLFTLLLYNVFIFIFTKEKIYLYYVLYLFFATFNHMSYTAYSLLIGNFFALQDNMIDKLAKIDATLGIYYLSLMVIFITLFTREFFNTATFKKIDLSLRFGLCVIMLIAIVSSFSEYILNISILASLLFLSYIFMLSIYFFIKKEENSFYFLVAWGVNLFGTILFLLFNMGIYIPKDGNYNYFYELCLIFEAFLFSIILSKKLNRAKELEASVATHKILVRELHHRIKNNLQFIVSIYRLKLRKFLDKEARAILGEAEQHILSISKIHEILYANKNLSSIDAKEYFLELLKEVQQSFAFENIEIKINAINEIDSNDAIYCGLIINELVTNAVKYAFIGKDSGVIEVDYKRENRLNTLKIKDNGIGFEKSINTNSFGLALVDKLVELELHGKIKFLNGNGAEYIINW